MFWLGLTAILVVIAAALLWLMWHPFRRLGRDIQAARAQELFVLQRERIQPLFLPAASATGKPRGLRWKDCQFDSAIQFARERQSRQLIALVGVTIAFEAIPGSDMEGVEAVGNLRNASAIFYFHQGQWLTVGKAVFNLNPDEAIAHFGDRYEQLQLSPAPSSSHPA
jgi:hypothetical protein